MPDSNDDYGFWDGDRERSHTGPIPRLKRTSAEPSDAPRRSHRTATRAPSPRSVAVRLGAGRPSSSRQPNPLVRRLGALCGVTLLAIPVALLVRGPGNDEQISSVDAAATVPALADVALTDAALAVSAVPAVPAVPVTTASAQVAPVTTPPLVIPVETAPAATAAAVAVQATTAESAPPVTTAATVASAGQSAARVETAQQPSPADTAHPVGVATPVVETKRTCAVEYTVQQGDYWISIAKNSSVKLAALLTANGAKVGTALYPGRTICLPANATAPTTTEATMTTAKPTATTTQPTSPPTTAKTTASATKPKPTSTTVPPTTAAPSTTAAPPKNTYSRAEVEQIIRNVWPDDLEDEAVRIATRESNLTPTVRNSCCYGLFQIYFTANKSSLVGWGITSAAMLYDPQVNAYAAYAMYLRAGGWGPWAM